MTPVRLDLPQGPTEFSHLVLDFTGTLSRDGELLPGVAERLTRLSESLQITILTADTFGKAWDALQGLPVEIHLIQNGMEKAKAVGVMGAPETIAMGNGRNDVAMMEVAGLSVAVVGPEGAAAPLLAAADVVTTEITDALDLILHPLRLKATLRD
jgi:soluble P-type ATPase